MDAHVNLGRAYHPELADTSSSAAPTAESQPGEALTGRGKDTWTVMEGNAALSGVGSGHLGLHVASLPVQL